MFHSPCSMIMMVAFKLNFIQLQLMTTCAAREVTMPDLLCAVAAAGSLWILQSNEWLLHRLGSFSIHASQSAEPAEHPPHHHRGRTR